MKGLDENCLPAYLIGFPSTIQQDVRNLVERAKSDYLAECERFRKEGKDHPVREEVYGQFIEVCVGKLRKNVQEYKIERVSAPNIFLAAACSGLVDKCM